MFISVYYNTGAALPKNETLTCRQKQNKINVAYFEL